MTLNDVVIVLKTKAVEKYSYNIIFPSAHKMTSVI